MKRRDFLKFIGVATLAPSLLVAAPTPLKLNDAQKMIFANLKTNERPIGIALEYIPKGKFGRVLVGGCFPPCYRLEEEEPK